MIRPRQGPSISRAVSGLTCPLCGRSLFPTQVDTGPSFHCKTGHQFALSQLAVLASPTLRANLQDFLDALEQDLKRMTAIAEEATRTGYVEIATVYYRQVPRLERRVEELRAGLSKALPDAERSQT